LVLIGRDAVVTVVDECVSIEDGRSSARMLFSLLFLMIIGTANTTAPQNAQPSETQPRLFHEHYIPDSEVPTGGGIIVGVQAIPDAETAVGGSVWAIIPKSLQGEATICVQVTSDDGRYEASAEYVISPQPTGLAHLAFPSQYKDKLESYGSSRVALLGRAKTSCTDASAEGGYILLSWSQLISPKTFVIRVNGGSATTVRLYESTTRSYSDCKIADNRFKKIAFDMDCSAQLQADTWDGFLFRQRFEVRLPDVPIKVSSK
jgi:hypothetical protein